MTMQISALKQCDCNLLLAAIRGDAKMARQALSLGADVNITDEDGDTPLHLSAKFGHFETIKALLSAAARPDIRNNEGDTPLHCICKNFDFLNPQKSREIICYMLENGCCNTLEEEDSQQHKPLECIPNIFANDIIAVATKCRLQRENVTIIKEAEKGKETDSNNFEWEY